MKRKKSRRKSSPNAFQSATGVPKAPPAELETESMIDHNQLKSNFKIMTEQVSIDDEELSKKEELVIRKKQTSGSNKSF